MSCLVDISGRGKGCRDLALRLIYGRRDLKPGEAPRPGPHNFPLILMQRLRVQGFIIIDYQARFPEAVDKIYGWSVADGCACGWGPARAACSSQRL
jgi:hypothetical protein